MTRLSGLKRFARTQLERIDVQLPLATWERVADPVKLNAIFTEREWKLESPVANLTEPQQDWIHWFACDPLDDTMVEIFFERFQTGVAKVWIHLRIRGRSLRLFPKFYKDNSEGHAYSAGGIRLECNAPFRRWRVAFNLMMEDPAAGCCTECQAICQPNSLFFEIIIDGERHEGMLFGSRLKFFGSSNMLRNAEVHVGYAVFTVPSGIVLTVNAYEMFSETPEVSKAIGTFLESSKTSDLAALKSASDTCVAAISKVDLPAPIHALLIEKLREVFGYDYFSRKFAVRSSAVGEDSEEMSAAGQMTTYLGVKGETKISSAVVKCWASTIRSDRRKECQMIDPFQRGVAENKTMMRINGITMFGYDIREHEAFKNGIVHGGSPPGLGMLRLLVNALWNIEETVREVRERAEELTVDVPEDGDALSQFLSIICQLPQMDIFLEGFMNGLMPSAVYNIFILNVLKKSQGLSDFCPELMVLLSKLLRSNLEVESALIPTELTALSNLLREDPMAERFVSMAPEEALAWLEADSGSAADQFRAIRSKHAHRCYKEFDIESKTWDIDPIPLVQTLQASVRSPQQEDAEKDEHPFSVDQLPKRPSLMQRKILNFLLPRAKYAVYAREATKSALIKSIHGVRLAMRRLGLQLQAEGRLPDPELIFFFDSDELYRLITTRDPSLLPRARRRQKMHPSLNRERFPVLFCGMPKPMEIPTISADPGDEGFRGTPVSQGKVEGPARVILDFVSQAHEIKKGEILITRATDTGWTPYFPLLSGVVTEVGGLLSHGAVVAREYGLPAIVGLIGITDIIKSGEIVVLDANNGILHRPKPGDEGLDYEEHAARTSSEPFKEKIGAAVEARKETDFSQTPSGETPHIGCQA
ncbi:uncharacterized protein LOC100901692 [Galendromus occidentalis]|uniref:Uncharacterized protein LOC100901692 n=1 Tax=Galendromus occidentalis TaxID=34638 RepID=A0AAJ7WI16_9ACAR|nr:uncharacterized protein LOC100901692 [Galendromus occidentalis]